MSIGGRCHRTGQVVQKQEILAHLTDLLRFMDMGIAKLVLGRIGASFDEIVAIFIQMKDSLAVTVHNRLRHGIQRLKAESRELEHRDGHM